MGSKVTLDSGRGGGRNGSARHEVEITLGSCMGGGRGEIRRIDLEQTRGSEGGGGGDEPKISKKRYGLIRQKEYIIQFDISI